MRRRLPLILLLMVVLIPFSPVLFGGKCFFYTDTFNFFYPLKKTVVDILKAGEIPHWNHLSAGGKPLIGGLQSGVFYPLNFVLVLLPFHRGFQIFFVLHYLLAGAFMFRLLRRMGIGPWGAALSGLTYALSGHLVSMANSVSILMVAAWLPLQIHLALDLLKKGRWVDIASLALVTSFAFLAGAPVTFAYTAGTVMIFLAVGVLKRARRGEGWRWQAAFTAALPLLVFGVSAVQFLPAQDFVSHSIRSEGVPFDDAAKYSLHPLRLATFVSPFLFGNLAADLPYRHQVAPQIIILITVYVGVLPLLLAPVAFLGSSKRPIFWGVALLVSLLIALGRHLPLYGLLYEVVPYFDQFRSPFKALVITTFSFSILAGLGLESLMADPRPKRAASAVLISAGAWALVLGVVFLVSLSLHGQALEQGDPLFDRVWDDMTGRGLVALAVLVAGATLLAFANLRSGLGRIGPVPILLFAAADLLLCAHASSPYWPDRYYRNPPGAARVLMGRSKVDRFRIYRSPPDPWAGLDKFEPDSQRTFYALRRHALEPNYGTLFGIEQFDSYESAVLFWHSKFQNFLERAPADQRVRMIGLFNVRYVISMSIVQSPALTSIPYTRAPTRIYDNLLAFPRAYLVEETVEMTDGNEMLAAILAEEVDFRRTVLVAPLGQSEASVREETQRALPHDPEVRLGPMKGVRNIRPPGWTTEAGPITYRPNEVEVQVNAVQAGFLVLNDTYHPDWKAWVNGEEVEVRRANYLVRAVPVPEGKSTVLFRFVSRYHRIGFTISFLTLGLLGAPVAVLLVRRRRKLQ